MSDTLTDGGGQRKRDRERVGEVGDALIISCGCAGAK